MRKEEVVQIQEGNRDAGKTFVIREMPAEQSERIAARLFFALAGAGVDIPDDVEASGMVGLIAFGMKALSALPFETLEPILKETFTTCVSFLPDPRNPIVRRGAGGMSPLMEDDIEEVSTRILLRKKIIALHTGFFADAAPSSSDSSAAMEKNTPITKTSRTR